MLDDRPLVVFDGDCGFCHRCIRLMNRFLRHPPTAIPWQSLDAANCVVDPRACATAVHYVDTKNRVWSGGDAVARILVDDRSYLRLPGLVMRLPVIRWLVSGAYVWVADHRHLFRGDEFPRHA